MLIFFKKYDIFIIGKKIREHPFEKSYGVEIHVASIFAK